MDGIHRDIVVDEPAPGAARCGELGPKKAGTIVKVKARHSSSSSGVEFERNISDVN